MCALGRQSVRHQCYGRPSQASRFSVQWQTSTNDLMFLQITAIPPMFPHPITNGAPGPCHLTEHTGVPNALGCQTHWGAKRTVRRVFGFGVRSEGSVRAALPTVARAVATAEIQSGFPPPRTASAALCTLPRLILTDLRRGWFSSVTCGDSEAQRDPRILPRARGSFMTRPQEPHEQT